MYYFYENTYKSEYSFISSLLILLFYVKEVSLKFFTIPIIEIPPYVWERSSLRLFISVRPFNGYKRL